MTEPPEPRRPEEDGGEETPEERARRLVDNSSLGTEGARSLSDRVSDEDVAEVLRRAHAVSNDEDYDAIWENADAKEIMGGLEDDALLDSIAQGVRGDLGPDELTELLSGLRDKPDATDIPVPNLGRVERGENVIPPRTEERGSMAIADDAQQLAQIANDETAMQAMEQATGTLGDAIGQLQQAGTTLSAIGQNLQVAGESAASQAATAGSLLGGANGQALAAQGQQIAQSISDALSKIAMIDTGDSVGKLQGIDLAALQGQVQALREAIKGEAQKHGGGA